MQSVACHAHNSSCRDSTQPSVAGQALPRIRDLHLQGIRLVLARVEEESSQLKSSEVEEESSQPKSSGMKEESSQPKSSGI